MALTGDRKARRPTDPASSDTPARVSFPRGTWLVLGIFGLFLGATLGGQFLLIEQQRDLARQQRNIAATTLRLVDPLLEDARPLAARARDRRPQVEAAARRADHLVRTTAPLVARLDEAGLPDTTRKVGTVFDALLSGDLPRTLAAVDQTTAALNERARLSRLLRGAITVLGTVRTTGLVRHADRRPPRRGPAGQDAEPGSADPRADVRAPASGAGRHPSDARGGATDEGHAANLDRKLGGEQQTTGTLLP